MGRTKKDLLQGIDGIKASKKIANNTVKIEFADGTKAIRLHDTNVVIEKNGIKELFTKGFKTNTTKDRINMYIAPAYIRQSDHVWYVCSDQKEIPFFDGIKIKDGKVLNASKAPKIGKRHDQLKRKIEKFVNRITEANLPRPEPGDCFICQFGKDSCLYSHLQENYLHGSLLVAAMRKAGYNDMQIGMFYEWNYFDYFKRALRKYLQKNLL